MQFHAPCPTRTLFRVGRDHIPHRHVGLTLRACNGIHPGEESGLEPLDDGLGKRVFKAGKWFVTSLYLLRLRMQFIKWNMGDCELLEVSSRLEYLDHDNKGALVAVCARDGPDSHTCPSERSGRLFPVPVDVHWF